MRPGVHAGLSSRKVASTVRAQVRARRANAIQVVGRCPGAAGPAPLVKVQGPRRVAGSPSALPASAPSGANADHLPPTLKLQCTSILGSAGGVPATLVVATSRVKAVPGVPMGP